MKYFFREKIVKIYNYFLEDRLVFLLEVEAGVFTITGGFGGALEVVEVIFTVFPPKQKMLLQQNDRIGMNEEINNIFLIKMLYIIYVYATNALTLHVKYFQINFLNRFQHTMSLLWDKQFTTNIKTRIYKMIV